MQLERTTLLTIVAEQVLESKLKELVRQAGAQGYTITDIAYGKGKHGERSGPADVTDNIQMILTAPKEIVDAILKGIEKEYAKSYAIWVCMHEVDVVRWTPAFAAAR
ncbi:MAG: P-II family nitrogen regulator [Nitrospiraceae bacterium]